MLLKPLEHVYLLKCGFYATALTKSPVELGYRERSERSVDHGVELRVKLSYESA